MQFHEVRPPALARLLNQTLVGLVRQGFDVQYLMTDEGQITITIGNGATLGEGGIALPDAAKAAA